MKQYLFGTLVTLEVAVANSSGQRINEAEAAATEVKVQVKPPCGGAVSVDVQDGDSTGVYIAKYLPTEIGVHSYYWSTTGTVVGSGERCFEVTEPKTLS